MQPSPTDPAKPAAPEKPEDKIRHLPAEVRASFRRFQAGHDLADLDPVIFAIMEEYIPRPAARPLADTPGTTRLIEDLGFDSLAISEVVFLTEDLFSIRITNEEIIQVRTLEDLRGFVRTKVAARTAG